MGCNKILNLFPLILTLKCHKFKDFLDVYLEAMDSDPLLTEHQLIGLCTDFFEGLFYKKVSIFHVLAHTLS